jgi:dipeptidyl aminopeptidase/acylaminoacyl peptidase
LLADRWVTETLWRIDADGANARQVGSPGEYDWEPKLSPDGTEVVFTRYDPPRAYWYTLMIRDLATGAERRVTADETEPEHPEWSPDGASIIYNTLHDGDHPEVNMQQIERVPSDNPFMQPEVLYAPDEGCCAYKPTYSPDGASIAFEHGNRLLRMNADGSGVTPVLVAPVDEVNHVAWGPTPG